MDIKILQAINHHAYQLAKNFGLQEADKEDVRGELILKALTIIEAITEHIEDFEEGEASLVTYTKRCLDNKASDIARDLRGLPPKVNSDDASAALDTEEQYKYSANRREGFVPLTVSMGGQLQNLSMCNHEHFLPLKMDIEAILPNLTPRQREVFELLEDGKTQEQIAEILGISQKNINKHIMKIRRIFED